MVYTYGPCAACVKHKFALRIIKKAYLRSYCYYSRFLCFDQSDFSCKISLIFSKQKTRC